MTVRRAMWALTVAAILLGMLHLALMAPAWRHLSLTGFWTAGSGVAIVVAGLLNVIALRAATQDWLVKAIWLVGNLLLTAFFVFAWKFLPQPQVAFGIAVFALLSAGTLLS